MLRVPITEVARGMVLALPVYHPDQPLHILLKPGFGPDERAVRRLRDLGIRQIWVRCPSLDSLRGYLTAELLERRAALAQQINAAFTTLQEESCAGLDFMSYQRALVDLAKHLLSHPQTALLVDEAEAGGSPLLAHSLRVTYLSVLLGLKLDAYLIRERPRLAPKMAKQVTGLGLGAMLHDIGLIEADEAVGKRHLDDPAGDAADPARADHAAVGRRMVNANIDATALTVIANHHQHYDGSGFPLVEDDKGQTHPARGGEIHVFARIACVADVFDRLRFGSGGSKGRPAVAAIKAMLGKPFVRWFDPEVVRGFIEVVPPFPPGTPLRLSDGRTAVAIEHNPRTPCQPVVQLVREGEFAAESDGVETVNVIDLAQRDDLTVAEADGVDVRPHLFRLRTAEPAPA